MLTNLKNELKRCNISYKKLGKSLNLSEKTVYSKINEITEFTLGEIKQISEILGADCSIDYLFAADCLHKTHYQKE